MKTVAWSGGGCRLGAAGIGLLTAALIPACGGLVDGEAGGNGVPVAIEALPEQLANAICENIAGCCHSAEIAFDLATCRANATLRFQQGVKEELRPNVRYDASAAGACVVAEGAYFKRCFRTGIDDLASCSRMFTGVIAPGGGCTRNDECASIVPGYGHCRFESDTALGVCIEKNVDPHSIRHGKLGGACAGNCSGSGDCAVAAPAGSGTSLTAACYGEEGVQCDFRTQTCQLLVALGEVCEYEGCVASAYCGDANVCTALKPNGATCQGSRECAIGLCVFGDTVAATGICGAQQLATPDACSGERLFN